MICDRDAIKVSRFSADPLRIDESGDVCGLYGSSWLLHETLKRTISRARVCYKSPVRSNRPHLRQIGVCQRPPFTARNIYLHTH